MAIYLLGDVQGCYDPLQRLLDKIRFDPVSDQLWSCGDLVNRGGQSLQVMQLLYGIRQQVSVTLGNHDLHLLAAHARNPGGNRRNAEFDAILRHPDCDAMLGWLNAQPLAAWSETHRMLRVHAGVIPAWDAATTMQRAAEVSAMLNSDRRGKFLKKMYGNRPARWSDELTSWKRLRTITNILTRIRVCNAEGRVKFSFTGTPDNKPRGYKAWFRHRHRLTRDVTMVFGHWAALGLRVRKRFIALDSGCVWGGQLTALRLEDRQVFQVEARD